MKNEYQYMDSQDNKQAYMNRNCAQYKNILPDSDQIVPILVQCYEKRLLSFYAVYNTISHCYLFDAFLI